MMCCLLFGTTVFAGPDKEITTKTSVKEYIKQWSAVAKSNMTRYHIPASITLAQGILESGYGNSRMAKVANNHFGIKCLGWKGEGYYQQNSLRSCYRKYRDTEECFQDHARILSSKDRYQFLFKLDITDYRSWARGLKQAGYATHGEYDRLLIRTIEEYKLYDIDRQMAKASKGKPVIAEKPKEVLLELAEKKETPMESMERLSQDIRILVDERGELLDEATIVVLTEADDFEVREPEVELVTVTTKRIITEPGETFEQIAEESGIRMKDLLDFNDLDAAVELRSGSPVYLDNKAGSAGIEMCTVRPSQTLWEISQKYGVKLRSLEKMNHVRHGENPPSGTVIRLR